MLYRHATEFVVCYTKTFSAKLDSNHTGYVRVLLACDLLRAWRYVDEKIFAETSGVVLFFCVKHYHVVGRVSPKMKILPLHGMRRYNRNISPTYWRKVFHPSLKIWSLFTVEGTLKKNWRQQASQWRDAAATTTCGQRQQQASNTAST